jgi:uncharacterized protein with PQ loop repeat
MGLLVHSYSWFLALGSSWVLQLAPLRQVRHIARTRTTSESSGAFYQAMALNSGVWVLHATMMPRLEHLLLWAHLPGLVLGLGYSDVFRRYTQKSKRPYNNRVFGAVLGALGLSWLGLQLASMRCDECARSSAEAFALVGGGASATLLLAAPLATAPNVLRFKVSDAMPMRVSAACAVHAAAWCSYGLHVKMTAIIWPNALGMFLSLAQLMLISQYPPSWMLATTAMVQQQQQQQADDAADDARAARREALAEAVADEAVSTGSNDSDGTQVPPS